MPDAPLPSREFCSIVVVGQMNPAIHHPSWYQSMKLLDKQEFDSAVSGPMLLMPQISQFAAPEFSIVCLPDRWEIQTRRLEAMDRILAAASSVFEILDHTPVSAFGFNFQFHRETSVDVGHILGSVVERLPLGLKLSGDVAGQLTLMSTAKGQKTTASVAKSQLGANIVFVSLNFHYDIIPNTSKIPAHFDLAPLLTEHFWPDEARSVAYVQSVVEGLPKIGGVNGSRS